MDHIKSDLTAFAKEQTCNYEKLHNYEDLKEKGQIFTPISIAKFMAHKFDLSLTKIRILDPGAGTGILTAAICNRINEEFNEKKEVNITAYEDDKEVIPILHSNLKRIKLHMLGKGHDVSFRIITENFLYENYKTLESYDLFPASGYKYDIIISNPPYFKVGKSDRISKLMNGIVHGQPNVYMFFLAVSSQLLSDNGQMVFITPRSFCSGLYFRKFRKWLLNNVDLTSIHVFLSRNETFENKVLQETIITKFVKNAHNEEISISESNRANMLSSKVISIPKDYVIDPEDNEKIIRIPKNSNDLKTIKKIKGMNSTLRELGYKISTGPIVSFRNKEYLINDNLNKSENVPLIWMQNLNGYNVDFPIGKVNKPQFIKLCNKTRKYILQNQNYVLLKRFTSKEQKRRVYASCYFSKHFDYEFVTFENHLNYIKGLLGPLSVAEVYGIMAYLNSSLVDCFFRIINGNTQVNAGEIEKMSFPSHEILVKIGEEIQYIKTSLNQEKIDDVISNYIN